MLQPPVRELAQAQSAPEGVVPQQAVVRCEGPTVSWQYASITAAHLNSPVSTCARVPT